MVNERLVEKVIQVRLALRRKLEEKGMSTQELNTLVLAYFIAGSIPAERIFDL